MDKHADNLLPVIEIGGTRFLYPAISTTTFLDTPVTATAGTAQPGRDAESFCHYPAYWLPQAV